MSTFRWNDLEYVRDLLVSYFVPGFEGDVLDAGLVLDNGLRDASAHGRLEELARQLDELAVASPDESAAEKNLMVWLRQTGIPDGTGFLSFLQALRGRVQEARLQPSILASTDERDGLRAPRASRFADKETADTACTQVLRRHEAQVRAWVADRMPQGIWRQHYYADLDEVVGKIMFAGAVGETRPTTAVAMVMKFDVESGNPYIYDAWPEIRLDEAVRVRFPELPHLFGGYFGDVPDRPWPAQVSFQSSTRDPARRRIADQLDELLTLDDEVLSHAVEALGSHVLPEAMRPWVERIRWRMDAFDWTAARTPE